MTRAVIFDIDGTLSNPEHRLHFVRGPKKDWGPFFDSLGDDTLVESIAQLRAELSENNSIVIVTGRPEKYRHETESWLDRWAIWYDKLYMRPDNDTRPDCAVKSQILDGIIEDGYAPWLVIDDRESVIEMWRDRGLTTLQCRPDTLEVPETAVLSIMVGPTGAGKSTWLQSETARFQYGIFPEHVVSSDQIRHDLCGDFKDQTKNGAVFEAFHGVAKARLRHGLPTVLDATHLYRKDRLKSALLVPDLCSVRYFVLDRSLALKRTFGGWRNDLPFDLIGKHSQTFGSQIKDIFSGDNLPNVTVHDLRRTE